MAGELKSADPATPGALARDEAQTASEGVLHPRLWRIDDSRLSAWPGDLGDDETGAVETMSCFAPEELAAIFRSLAAAGWDAILVGGQAVNLWASHYDRDLPAWRELRPYTSRDLDYYAGLAEARLAMRVLGAQGQLNLGFDPGPNAGVLKVPLAAGRELLVDILTNVYGVGAAELERTAVTFSGRGALSGLSLRVIHPLLLLEGKAASLGGLPQGQRQDAKHLRILILVVHEWLRAQCSQPRQVFRAVERLAACAASPEGLHAFAQGIDLGRAIPLEPMRADAAFAAFFERPLPQLLEKIAGKRQRHLEALRQEEP
jgi:hypothetical protein